MPIMPSTRPTDRQPQPIGPGTTNLLYCNDNPNPSTVCNECAQHIGHVFERDAAPSLPRHAGCFCYYQETTQPADSFHTDG